MRGDADRLRRLVTVLVDNAIRHGHERGTGPRHGAARGADRGGRRARASRPADRDRVFDRFWRGEAAAPGGSGLGLAIAAWIAERHGGRIVAGTSRLGGARFDITLPAG